MKIIFPIFVSFIMFHSAAFPQENISTLKISSLAEILQKAVLSNPKQAIYQQRIRQATYNYKAARGFLLPVASGTFNGTDNLSLGVTPVPGELVGQPGTTFYAQFGKRYNYNAGLNLGQTLFDWQAIQQSAIAKKNIELNRLDQESFVQNLKEQTARVYLTVLVAKGSLFIAGRDEQLADSLVVLVRQRFAEGTTDQLAVNQSLINYNNIQQNKQKSQVLYDQGIENLKILLGEHPSAEIILTEELPSGVADTEIFTQPGKDHTLDTYLVQSELAGLQSKSQQAVAYPKLSANAYFGGQQFRNDFGFSFRENAWSRYQYIGISLSVPFFTGFTNTNKYRSSKVQTEIAHLQYAEAKQNSAVNDQLLLKNLATYQQLLKASAQNFKLYGSTMQLNKQKYQEGLVSMETYLKAFLDYLNAENMYLNDLSQLYTVKATLIARQ